ncbi:hypothetical protein CYR40_00135 [Chimaeribacter arupi]|uniref:hypothetical protein n=1 Tax=Chimaeribacter arupi TaxID=2060066 RepID=UPI000C7DEFD3|nr:hypothetical protein [Chimaeribacter arupi]PLR50952.1 hypothetical protein CYR40_00135 [Chimaeribacter arupi]
MKKTISILALSLLIISHADAARGRKPCSGSKGGISHCTAGGAFVCNDGSLSQSKRFCSGYGSEKNQRIESPVPTKKVQKNKTVSKKKAESQHVVENDSPVKVQERKPTCAPIYMAHKPGYTNLPICSGNQY